MQSAFVHPRSRAPRCVPPYRGENRGDDDFAAMAPRDIARLGGSESLSPLGAIARSWSNGAIPRSSRAAGPPFDAPSNPSAVGWLSGTLHSGQAGEGRGLSAGPTIPAYRGLVVSLPFESRPPHRPASGAQSLDTTVAPQLPVHAAHVVCARPVCAWYDRRKNARPCSPPIAASVSPPPPLPLRARRASRVSAQADGAYSPLPSGRFRRTPLATRRPRRPPGGAFTFPRAQRSRLALPALCVALGSRSVTRRTRSGR